MVNTIYLLSFVETPRKFIIVVYLLFIIVYLLLQLVDKLHQAGKIGKLHKSVAFLAV